MQRCRVMKKSIALLAGRWPSQPATRYRPSPNTSCIDAPGDPAPSHTAYRVAAPAALHAQPEIAREQRAGMRSETAVHRCLTEASAVEGDHWQAFPQLKAGVVGLAGLEPAASSSGEDHRPRWQTTWYLPRSTRTSPPPRSGQRPRGRAVLPIFIRQGWPQAMSHLSEIDSQAPC
jgi:hypothetical protein